MTDTPRCAPDEDPEFFAALDRVFRDHPDAAGRYAILSRPPSADGKGRARPARSGRNAGGALVLEFADEQTDGTDGTDAPQFPPPPEKPEGSGDCLVFDYYPGYGIRCSTWDLSLSF